MIVTGTSSNQQTITSLIYTRDLILQSHGARSMGFKHMNSLIDLFGTTEMLGNEPETEALVPLLKAFSVLCILESLQPPFLFHSDIIPDDLPPTHHTGMI